ncbi:PREDICTED: berberine bridge enzyme-like 21 [Ipomoea nil]|uniref:berberine bridge enzyme-like 21 n=1 Tax=Ipomoea nil TaxID=35883 RepID=UPI000901B3F0|nr:PREDICTED: berberine bridge enzyme-like 21 [Ipomoea nil]
MNDKMKIFIFSIFLVFQALCSVSSAATGGSIYDKFVGCLTGAGSAIPRDQVSKIVYAQNNTQFSSVLNAYVRNLRYNTSATPKPVIIVTPLEESHVPAVVLCAKNADIQIKIRSGGHDYEGLSYVSEESNFIILDMFNLRSIDVDMATETAWVQAGATLGELYYRIAEKSPVHGFPGGVCPTVGVGGHFSGAGYGNMLRQYGLTVDHVVDARIVDATGRILDAKAMGEDLFWAIRGGGGGSFGVILAYKIKLVQVPKKVTYFRVERLLSQNATDVVLEYQKAVTSIDSNLFIRLLLQPITPPSIVDPVTGKKVKQNKTIRVTSMGLFLGDKSRLLSITDKELPVLGLKSSDLIQMTWIQSVLQWANFDYKTTKPEILLSRAPDELKFGKRKSDYVQTPIPKDGLESLWKKMVELGKVGLVFNSYGGKLAETPDDATPFPHRAGILFKIQYSVSWSESGEEAETQFLTQAKDLHTFMTPFVSSNPRQAYLNYRDLDIGTTDNGPKRYEQAKVFGAMYFKNNFDRLVKVKTAVDPDNYFRNEQSIPPLSPIGSRKHVAKL